jgi:hypothetical protein
VRNSYSDRPSRVDKRMWIQKWLSFRYLAKGSARQDLHEATLRTNRTLIFQALGQMQLLYVLCVLSKDRSLSLI